MPIKPSNHAGFMANLSRNTEKQRINKGLCNIKYPIPENIGY
jgi:hypothetical protein